MGEVEERQALVEQIFKDYDVDLKGDLSPIQLQSIHADMRVGGISIPQIKAAIEYVCVGENCEVSELFHLLKEFDRRYYLVQDLRWEFSMLDTQQRDAISEEQARWFVQTVHGRCFSSRKWEHFLKSRAVPGSGVTFAEIEVHLCNVPSIHDLLGEEAEELRQREERERKRQELEKMVEEEKQRRRKEREEQRKRQEAEMKKRMAEEDKRRKQEEKERLKKEKEREADDKRRKQLEEEEERGRKEAEEREKEVERQREAERERKRQELAEAQRLRDIEEKHRREEAERRKREEQEAKRDETELQKAIEDEKAAEEEASNALRRKEEAKDGREKMEAEEDEKRARLRAKESRNKRIRYNLKVAVKTRDINALPKAIAEFKKAKLPDDDGDLAKGERLLKEIKARDDLKKAVSRRNLKQLEGAINYVKRNGLEVQLAGDLIEANKVLLQLRRLERIRAEILELKQSTVAEIRSYQKPPPIVHTVMTATFLLLGHEEKETRVWKTVQALVGKTGKDGLKRRCLGAEPANINVEKAERAKHLIGQFDLEAVRDVSAGAATFYVWSETMIEECLALAAQRKEMMERGEWPPKAEPKQNEGTKSVSASKDRSRSTSPTKKTSNAKSPSRERSKSKGRSSSVGKSPKPARKK